MVGIPIYGPPNPFKEELYIPPIIDDVEFLKEYILYIFEHDLTKEPIITTMTVPVPPTTTTTENVTTIAATATTTTTKTTPTTTTITTITNGIRHFKIIFYSKFL
jgi:hypothetical protein